MQTAPIALLPSELLSPIIEIIAREGMRKPDLVNLLKTCRAIYCAGLPVRFRKVTLDERTGPRRLAVIEGGPTGMDKTSYVREILVPGCVNLDSLTSLKICSFYTKEFLQFSGGLFPKLTKLDLRDPRWNLSPSEYELQPEMSWTSGPHTRVLASTFS
jgi:hypothetical protein